MGKRKKKRREETDELEERLPPVLTVTCPNCGGTVNNAELGERTTCTFCGTDLHLPRIDSTPDEPPAPPSEEEPLSDGVPPGFEPVAAPHRPQWVQGLVAGCVALVFFVAVWLAVRPPPMSPDLPSYPDLADRPDPEMDAISCYGDCVGACAEIPPDPNIFAELPSVKCMDACGKKCNYPPKVPVAECRSKCTGKCAGAPDEAMRAACMSGCNAECSAP